ncbi:hypothetical protein CKAH01_15806 [Colletotrichum kahawae]|uniref:Protein kinase domain-containing protein n=1 Tax=Colletotrichum kahawae TaxID=34407 RepID=A0AAD9YG50_COLKA|nr:hypothetical protein CKAH01_15806 [Colletotrichum kahawae]
MYHDTGDASPDVPRIMPALVLEYAEYGSLKTFQQQGGGSSFVDQIQIAIDTAHGLKALHDCGIIHGDVKPSNLLVCSAFYDNFPIEGLEDNLRKMKSSGIMSTLIPLRVLNSHQNDDLPLMILCKIWRYSLQASPSSRFQSMDRILSLLEVLRHAASSLESAPSESGDGPPVQRALDSLRELTSGTPIIQGTPADVFSNVCLKLAEGVVGNLPPGSGSVKLPAIDAKRLHDTTAQVVQMLLIMNKTAMQGDNFENPLYNLIAKRVMDGLVQTCGQRLHKGK